MNERTYSEDMRNCRSFPRSFAKGLFAALFLACVPGISACQNIDSPMPLTPFVPYNGLVANGQSSYTSAKLQPGKYKIVVDIQRPGGDGGNLIAQVSILDSDGAVIQPNVISFNEIDTAFRRTYSFQISKPQNVEFQIANGPADVNYWITLLDLGKAQSSAPQQLTADNVKEFKRENADWFPYPFFGKILPGLLALNSPVTGSLGGSESTYYIALLPAGELKIIGGLDNGGTSGNLIGYVALLAADGGNQQIVLPFNEIGRTTRKAALVKLQKPGVYVFRFENQSGSSQYYLQVHPNES